MDIIQHQEKTFPSLKRKLTNWLFSSANAQKPTNSLLEKIYINKH